jgi:hypothetical protein
LWFSSLFPVAVLVPLSLEDDEEVEASSAAFTPLLGLMI